MADEAQLREKLRKIEALFAGAGTAGEKNAGEAALERVRARLAELQRSDEPIEMQFSLPDQWARRLFVALCRRYGLEHFPISLHRILRRRSSLRILGAKASMAWAMASQSCWTVRAAALRSRALSFEKAFSIGLRSGL